MRISVYAWDDFVEMKAAARARLLKVISAEMAVMQDQCPWEVASAALAEATADYAAAADDDPHEAVSCLRWMADELEKRIRRDDAH